MCPTLSCLPTTWNQPSARLGACTEGEKVSEVYVYLNIPMVINIHSWLYTLFLALDGNFRMSQKGVSSKERDPSLIEGHGYFVDEDKLAAHLEAHKGKPQEVCQVH